MHDAVDERRRARRVRENGRPLVEGQVRREDETSSLVATADDLEEQIGVTAVVGQVANLVDAEQRPRGVVPEASVEGARRVLGAEVEEELRCRHEERRVPGEQ